MAVVTKGHAKANKVCADSQAVLLLPSPVAGQGLVILVGEDFLVWPSPGAGGAS